MMADRVLPSRERIRQGLDGERRGVRRESEILRAYASGRLVDRVAIDHDAAFEAAGGGVRRDVVWEIVDAALGVTDE